MTVTRTSKTRKTRSDKGISRKARMVELNSDVPTVASVTVAEIAQEKIVIAPVKSPIVIEEKNVWVAKMRVTLLTNRYLQARALIAIFKRQTAEEISQNRTRETNGRGFNQLDAAFLTSMARTIIRSAYMENGVERYKVSDKQCAVLARCMPKYSGQLYEVYVQKMQAKG
ncbi:hypothetical protein UFOVP967_62 [uncultured Caudovirales phage]|uniref:Uncharacterized protein n=1 Tax=uncultured Caudovirales phage TaxID=2100421 RepID=A0A6J5PZE7_9CAUD|nr:hypothetical protein UFOVP521_54 [uncultured Caudovirales phage]CAB4167420.1 hypothetical protein UFOVP856_26 [uncultured Caudovirales phage]CAB4174565.1 hypothetical protein UFOVP967_62 [uncultured Caudovirales phage]CAB4180350.1 hypothetical protein UFOVP1036_19 [uncultured Caudovirales phage]CAB4186250.1 hypothetical protein UFOVP1132_48 [uncultured Caudovirales phage]